MKRLCASVSAGSLLLAAAAIPAAASDRPTLDEVDRINGLLMAMQCEVDEDNIEKKGDGYELDDVICVDGQFDIELDGSFNIIEKRAE